MHTLKLLEHIQTRGRLGLRHECFDTFVTGREVQAFAEVQIWSAPADAEPQLPGRVLPPESQVAQAKWLADQRLNESTGLLLGRAHGVAARVFVEAMTVLSAPVATWELR